MNTHPNYDERCVVIGSESVVNDSVVSDDHLNLLRLCVARRAAGDQVNRHLTSVAGER